MEDHEKLKFRDMLISVYDLYNKKPLDTIGRRIWWKALSVYNINIIQASFETWVKTKNKAPTPYDIITICRSKSIPTTLSLPQPKPTREQQDKVKKAMENIKEKLKWK